MRLGHGPTRHAAHVSYPIQALNDDPQEIYRALQDAKVMRDYVLHRGREKGLECESGPATERDRSAVQLVPAEQNLPELRRLFPPRDGRAEPLTSLVPRIQPARVFAALGGTLSPRRSGRSKNPATKDAARMNSGSPAAAGPKGQLRSASSDGDQV